MLVEQQMDVLSPEDLEKLLETEREPCVSLFMPTHRVWSETSQDPIRLRNLARTAEADLVERGIRRPDAHDLMTPAYALETTESFWRTQSDGLALFISPEIFVTYRLPLSVREKAVVGDRFHVRPLLRLFEGEGRFFVLALSAGDVRLLSGTRYSLSEMDLKDVPTSLSEALRFDEYEKQHQYHSGAAPTMKGSGDRAAVFHGHGVAGDDASVKKRIVEFLRTVDNGVCDILAEQQEPLILAGLDHLRGLYRTVNHYTYLADEAIDTNPDELDAEELHRRAWKIVEPRYRAARREAKTAYEELENKSAERVADNLEDIVPAAYFRRVKDLFVRGDAEAWGSFDPEAQKVEVHEEPQTDDYDLIDLVVTHTLKNGGTVYLVEEGEEDVPTSANAAAIFRY